MKLTRIPLPPALMPAEIERNAKAPAHALAAHLYRVVHSLGGHERLETLLTMRQRLLDSGVNAALVAQITGEVEASLAV